MKICYVFLILLLFLGKTFLLQADSFISSDLQIEREKSEEIPFFPEGKEREVQKTPPKNQCPSVVSLPRFDGEIFDFTKLISRYEFAYRENLDEKEYKKLENLHLVYINFTKDYESFVKKYNLYLERLSSKNCFQNTMIQDFPVVPYFSSTRFAYDLARRLFSQNYENLRAFIDFYNRHIDFVINLQNYFEQILNIYKKYLETNT